MCLNRWQVEGLCLLGHYATPLSKYKETDGPTFFPPLQSQEIHASRILRYLIAKSFGNLGSKCMSICKQG